MGQRHSRAFTRWTSRRAAERGSLPSREVDPSFSVEVFEKATHTWVTAVGELDLNTADAFDRCVWEAQTPARGVVLDLRRLTFIDSAGLRSVVAARLCSVRWAHRLQVLIAPGQVRRMLSVSGFDQMIEASNVFELRMHATQLGAE